MPLKTDAMFYILGMTQAGSARVWVATNHSLRYYDASGPHSVGGEDFEFDVNASLAADPDDPERVYFVSRHRLFMAQQSGTNGWQVTAYFDQDALNSHLQLNSISFVTPGPHGKLWLGYGKGICSVSNYLVHPFRNKEGLPKENWKFAFVDSFGAVWPAAIMTFIA